MPAERDDAAGADVLGSIRSFSSVVLLAIMLLLPLASTGGADETLVMTNLVSKAYHHDNVALGETKQCQFLPGAPPDAVCYTNGPNNFNSQQPQISPFVGVIVNTTGSRVHIPVWCDNDVERPGFDYYTYLSAAGTLADGGDHYDDDQACHSSWQDGVEDVPDFGDDLSFYMNCNQCKGLGGVGAVTYMGNNGAWSDHLELLVVYILGMQVQLVGALTDGAEEDLYLEINDEASEYVLSDPSGDDILRNAAGSIQVVVDGVTVHVGDLDVVRTADGLLAKKWTITHHSGDTVVAALRDAGGDQVFDLSVVGP